MSFNSTGGKRLPAVVGRSNWIHCSGQAHTGASQSGAGSRASGQSEHVSRSGRCSRLQQEAGTLECTFSMCSCHHPIFMNLNFSSLSHEKRQKRSDSFTAHQDRLQFRLFLPRTSRLFPTDKSSSPECLGFLSFTQILLASIVSINLAISASLRWLLTDKTEFSNNHGLVVHFAPIYM